MMSHMRVPPWQEERILLIFLFYFIFGCVGSSFLCEGFLQLRQAGAPLHRGAWASHYRGLSCCGAQAPDPQAQQLWLTGLVALWHVGSSQTRARTRVPCISRQILNHCATREAQEYFFKEEKEVGRAVGNKEPMAFHWLCPCQERRVFLFPVGLCDSHTT